MQLQLRGTTAALEHRSPYATAYAAESEVELTERIYRHVNERIRELSRLYDFGEPLQMFCECCATACTATIRIDPGRYEDVRMLRTRFFVAPGHTGPHDAVVERTAEFWIVEIDDCVAQKQEQR